MPPFHPLTLVAARLRERVDFTANGGISNGALRVHARKKKSSGAHQETSGRGIFLVPLPLSLSRSLSKILTKENENEERERFDPKLICARKAPSRERELSCGETQRHVTRSYGAGVTRHEFRPATLQVECRGENELSRINDSKIPRRAVRVEGYCLQSSVLEHVANVQLEARPHLVVEQANIAI